MLYFALPPLLTRVLPVGGGSLWLYVRNHPDRDATSYRDVQNSDKQCVDTLTHHFDIL